MKSETPLVFLILMILLAGCMLQPAVGDAQSLTATAPAAGPTLPASPVTITGWFVTVWNGAPHYSITDAQNQTTELLVEDAVEKPLGGLLELDRKRVTVMGEVVSNSPRTIRVISIQAAGPE